MHHDVLTRRRWLAVALGAAAAAGAALLPGPAAAAGAAVLPGPVAVAVPPVPVVPAPLPAPVPAPPVASTTGCGAGARAVLLCLVNRERRAAGLAPLRRDRRIARAATRHARDMARRGYFAHQRSGGPDLGARLSRAGWRGSAWGEAIASGCGASGAPRAIVDLWLASPPHRAILLGARYRVAGVGVASARRCTTWVLDVGRA